MMNSTTVIDPPHFATMLRGPSKLKSPLLAFLILAMALALSELFCRYVLGLGDPPLFQADRTMEFLLQPSKTYYRFHNRFSVNRYAMRADDFPPQKSSHNELRVLIIGDS